MFFLFFVFHRHFCGHGEFSQKVLKYQKIVDIPKKSQSEPTLKKVKARRENIRIHMDYTYLTLENTDDTKRCYQENQVITWFNISQVCVEADLMTQEKYEVLTKTLDNVANYLTQTLRVVKSDPIPIVSIPEYPVPTNEVDTDLYIGVFVRPFGKNSGTLASASTVARSSTDDRPTQGIINVNLQYLPNEPSDLSTKGRRDLFDICLHEIIHVLGLAEADFKYWRDSDGKPYTNFPLTIHYHDRKRPASIINTPSAHAAVVERYGVTEFQDVHGNTYPSGVELEDAGGPGTQMSHFESRVYFTELMAPLYSDYAYISNITLAVLNDMGWYDVNFNMCEPYPYGDYRSIIGETKPFKDFLSKSPTSGFPRNYFPDDDQWTYIGMPYGCSYDHHFPGIYNIYKCSDGYQNYCDDYFPIKDRNGTTSFSPGFYLEEGLPFPSITLDSICIPMKNQKGLSGEKSDVNSYCALYNDTLNPDDLISGCFPMECQNHELFILAGDTPKKCSKKWQEIFINSSVTLLCPDPQVICGIINFTNYTIPYTPIDSSNKPSTNQTEKPSDQHSGFTTNSDLSDSGNLESTQENSENIGNDNNSDGKEPKNGMNPLTLALIVIAATIAVIVTIIVTVLYVRKRKNKYTREEP
ncbi:Clan MA, family M8 [Tritrichomonas foetus]|uniref:Clan MA, family M8 n=1 Tax=Tritrichomonas foetus TaxID=1144522 RepID=A0A1J4JE15_9EUKA|nr:Clan MA, family M8 [Tritrichomonas foetus]|eukprot:OHS96889.1 Clan MA, family M8 [Tritrichomonas foetus]